MSRVLIVGAGPSGLSAAYHLTRFGHQVEIREAGPLAGGMLHFGIPAYRLPRNELDQDIQRILDMGVKVTTQHKVDDVLAEMQAGDFDEDGLVTLADFLILSSEFGNQS